VFAWIAGHSGRRETPVGPFPAGPIREHFRRDLREFCALVMPPLSAQKRRGFSVALAISSADRWVPWKSRQRAPERGTAGWVGVGRRSSGFGGSPRRLCCSPSGRGVSLLPDAARDWRSRARDLRRLRRGLRRLGRRPVLVAELHRFSVASEGNFHQFFRAATTHRRELEIPGRRSIFGSRVRQAQHPEQVSPLPWPREALPRAHPAGGAHRPSALRVSSEGNDPLRHGGPVAFRD